MQRLRPFSYRSFLIKYAITSVDLPKWFCLCAFVSVCLSRQWKDSVFVFLSAQPIQCLSFRAKHFWKEDYSPANFLSLASLQTKLIRFEQNAASFFGAHTCWWCVRIMDSCSISMNSWCLEVWHKNSWSFNTPTTDLSSSTADSTLQSFSHDFFPEYSRLVLLVRFGQ